MYDAKRTIRVDSYDFFGYLAPGTLVLLSLTSCILQIEYKFGLRGTFDFIFNKTHPLTNAQFLILTILFIIFAYIAGHLTSSLSSFIFEKTIVGKILNYPFKSIVLGKSPDTQFSSISYRAFVTLFFATIFFFIAGIRKPSFYFFNHPIYLYCSTCSILIIAIFLKIIDEPVLNKFPQIHHYYRAIVHSFFWVFAIFFYTSERFSSHFFGQIKTLPEETRILIKEKYKSVFKKELEATLETEVFWSIYWYTTSKNTYIRNKTDKWLILYGFMRNLSCSALISSALIVLPSHFGIPISNFSRVAGVTLFILSIVFSFRYYYIYFGYYSKTIFRAFTYLDFDNDELTK